MTFISNYYFKAEFFKGLYMSSVKYIVGERFYNFCNNHNQIYKINDFFEKIETNDIDKINVYVVGQCFSNHEIKKLSHVKIQDPDIIL